MHLRIGGGSVDSDTCALRLDSQKDAGVLAGWVPPPADPLRTSECSDRPTRGSTRAIAVIINSIHVRIN